MTDFIRLLSKHERGIYAYILSLVPNWADADDIFQETNVRLWEQFDRFETGTNFGAWARTIAHYMVLTFREKTGRERVHFSQAFVDAVAGQIEQTEPEVNAERRALEHCLTELPTQSHRLLTLIYTQGIGVTAVASQVGRTVASTYKAVSRIRFQLRDCMKQRIRQRGQV